ncbi:hypothetical protein I311_03783 [Cryptococcus gattii NT-10]|nr:hypothetical protein I311_03783 [Cryptococcus gattii NT-10]
MSSLASFLPQQPSPEAALPVTSSYRISCLPPPPTIPFAGISQSEQRYLYFGVRRGFVSGVYTDWKEAQKQILNHPEPALKTFSTRLAAEAYVSGWDGAGRHSLPPSTPRPLREHLAMSFPGSVNVQAPGSQRRPSYHARLLAASSTELGSLALDTSPSPIRPGLISRSSYRSSAVHISSPLRQQVDDESDDSNGERSPTDNKHRSLRKAANYVGAGGLLSPPQSPERKAKRLGDFVMERERPTQRRALTDSKTCSSRTHSEFPAQSGSRPLSPPTSPIHQSHTRRPSDYSKSSLWADSVPQPEPVTPGSPQPDFADPTIPKFSRSGLRKSGVVMPVAAKRSSSSLSLKSRGSLFSSSNDSSSSIGSSSSKRSDKTMRRPSHSRQPSSSHLSKPQFSSLDRLATLAETSKRELQLNDEDLDAIPSLSPPRPAFMRRVSSASSIGSNDSFGSMGSMTSGSSAQTSSLESCEPILEEAKPDVHIQQSKDSESIPDEHALVVVSGTCTKSDGDASVDSGSMKHVKAGKSKGGGMFKRLAKVLGLEKKKSVGAGRRGSM